MRVHVLQTACAYGRKIWWELNLADCFIWLYPKNWLIVASVCEPHTSELHCNFSYIYIKQNGTFIEVRKWSPKPCGWFALKMNVHVHRHRNRGGNGGTCPPKFSICAMPTLYVLYYKFTYCAPPIKKSFLHL